MKPSEAIDWLNERLEYAEHRGYSDEHPAATFVARTSRGLPVRPKVVDHKPNGERLYMLTVKQVRRWRNLLVEHRDQHTFELAGEGSETSR